MYWYAHFAKAPFLAKFAVIISSISPASAATERAFQIESDVFAADRPQLSNENTEAETYIRRNYNAVEHSRRDPDYCPEIENVQEDRVETVQ